MPPRVYEPDLAPISFGWIDADGVRFIFRRVATPQGEDGQPAAFGAHVLAVLAELCPADVAIRLWGAENLWRDIDDGGDDLVLPDLTADVLAELGRSPEPDPALVRNFLGVVLVPPPSDRQCGSMPSR